MIKRSAIIIAALFLAWAICHADTWKQTTDSDFYGGSLNALAVMNTGIGASLSLASGEFALPGNNFIINGSNDYLIYNSGDRLDFAFSVPAAMTVTAAVIYGQWLGTASYYDIGLLADAYGGTTPVISQWLLPGTDNRVTNLLSSGNSYYMRVTFSSDAYLGAATAYHLLFKGASGMDGSNYFKPRATTPNNQLYASNGKADAYQMALQSINSGVDWTANPASQPVFLLEYLDPLGAYTDSQGRPVSYIGNPYYLNADTNVYGSNYAGQVFGIKTPVTISKVRIYCQLSGSTPADDLHIVVQDITDLLNIVLLTDEVFVRKSSVYAGFSWISHTMISPVSFQANHTYRVFFKSTGSSSGGCYQVKADQVYQNASQGSVFSLDAVCSATYGGTGSYMVYTTGAA